jgi:hypothetical protein
MVELQIFISDHARERMRERLGCHESKYLKIACKAWRSNEKCDMREVPNPNNYIRDRGDITHYKKFMGKIYVFVENRNGNKTLLTVMPSTTSMARKRSLKKVVMGSDHDRRKERKALWNTES